MKKTTFTAAFLFAIGLTAALASEDSYAAQIESKNPQTEIKQAGDSSSNIRNILSTQLPTTLRKELKKEYKDYWISGLYEQGNNKHLAYYITIENADQVVKLDATGSKNWTVQSTVIKPL